MPLRMQIRFMRRQPAMPHILIDRPNDKKKHNSSHKLHRAAKECVPNRYSHRDANQPVNQMLRQRHLAAFEMKSVIATSVIEIGKQENGNQDHPHGWMLSQTEKSLNA